ncbi:hypothetical protein K502DRAFT_339721 [Neoconidiobolus thromboides FSU 785]|nr:hypothetical protein K502DRAFT_339721 [Neoconidiobolus thromboides FSU 785]
MNIDANDFNEYEFINELIEDESDLSQLDLMEYNIHMKLKSVDKELQSLLIKQLELAQDHKLKMLKGEKETKLLIEKIQYLRNSSEVAELSVRQVTEGIKGLDLAKKNIIACITFSKRLQMLVSAVDKLKQSIEFKDYETSGHLMQAVIELFLNFQTFKKIRPIYELGEVIHQLQDKLMLIIYEDFKQSFDSNGKLKNKDNIWLKQACDMIDYIHTQGKKMIIEYYVNLQINEYIQLFQSNEELSELEYIKRRFNWLKIYLSEYDNQHSQFFPQHWYLNELVCKRYCEITSTQLTDQLELNQDINLMIKVLLLTIQFEQQLDLKFQVKNRPDAIPFQGFISCYFEPYLNRFIDKEQEELHQFIIESQNNVEIDEDSQVIVFKSSTHLLLKYQEALNTLSKVNGGKCLILLAKLFQQYFQQYLNLVLKNFDKKITTEEELKFQCHVLNSTKYCLDSMLPLQEKLEQTLDETYFEKIDFEKEMELYNQYLSHILNTIVKGGQQLMEAGYLQFSKMMWGTWSHLSSYPEYLTHFLNVIKLLNNNLKKELNYSSYYHAFCNRFVESFIIKWMEAIFRLKRLNEFAIRQLLEDGDKLMNKFNEMITFETNENNILIQNFKKRNNELYNQKIKKYLNLIQFPLNEEDIKDSIKVQKFMDLLLEIATEPQFPFFLRVMEVKNIKRKDQDLLRQELQSRLGFNLDIKRNSLDSSQDKSIGTNFRRMLALPIIRERSSPSNLQN